MHSAAAIAETQESEAGDVRVQNKVVVI